MKRLLILSLSLSFAALMHAQTYVGLKGHMASTWVLNQNISDAGDELDYKGSYAGGAGVHGIYMLGPQSGLGLSLGMSRFEQQTQGTVGGQDYVNLFQMKYTDIALMYTYLSEGGLYLEVGPQFSLRKDNVDETYDFNGDFEFKESISDPNLNSSTLFGVFGIGGFVSLNEELKLMVGLRFGYGFTDLTNELSAQEFEDLDPDKTSSYTYVAQGAELNQTTLEQTLNYQASTPAFASFNLGLFYTIE